MKKIIKLIIPVLIIFLLAGCSSNKSRDTHVIQSGKLNLRAWDNTGSKNILLAGQWEFYWKKFIYYNDLQNNKPDMYAEVPDTWDKYMLKGKRLPGTGYATYRLHVVTDLQAETQLGLLLNTFSSAYRLYINEKLVTSCGRPADSLKEEVGEFRPRAVYFQIPDKEFDIIVQVSNYEHAAGGFWFGAYLGGSEGIQSLHDNKMGKELLLIGTLAIISAYYLYLYIVRPETKYTLSFSFFCASFILVLDSVGQFIIPGIFPWLNYKAVHFLWYMSIACGAIALLMFTHELFKSKLSDIIVKIYTVLFIGYLLIILFTEPVFYSKLIYIYIFFGVLCIICSLIIIGIGIKKGCKDGWINIVSILIMAVVYIHDNLYRNNLINCKHGELIYYGSFLFLFIQMVIQTLRIKAFYNKITATELAFLQAQIKPHFIYNSLNTFISISYYDIEKARELLVHFSDYLRKCFDIKNIDQFVSLKSELELAKTYVEIEKVRFEERLEVQFEEPEDTDVKVPILILQPIIENAIIHGVLPKPEGGRIEVTIRNEERRLAFCVKDNGVGMDINKSKDILKDKSENRVGLSNINSRLKKLYKKGLRIISSPEAGTEVIWYVPLSRKYKKVI